MKQYIVFLHVRFNVPFPALDPAGSPPVLGYFQSYGVSAPSERIADQLARQALLLDDIAACRSFLEQDCSVEEINLKTHDQNIAHRCTEPDVQGIWYKTGRVLYDNED
jgi:hypothetical protein